MWRGLGFGFLAGCIFEFCSARAQAASVLWSFEATNAVQSSPAIGPDGTIYFGAGANDLCAVSPAGAMKWRYSTNQFPPRPCLAPAIGEDGTIYAGFANVFVALNPEGSLQWKYPPSVSDFNRFDGRGASLAADGSIFAAPASTVIKLAPDGSVLWRAEYNGNSQPGWPVLTAGGVVSYGSYHANVLTYSADGIRLWSAFNTYLFNFDAALGRDGTMYGSVYFALLSLNAIGRTNWIFSCKGHPLGSAAIDVAGDIYFGTDQGWFYAIGPDGNLKWSRQFGARLNCSPAITEEGMIHFGDQSGQFFSLQADGSTNWVLYIGPGTVDSSPVIADDGTIFVGCGSRLVAIAGQSGPAPSAWPMYRHDARHTARQVNLSVERPVLTANRRGDGRMEVSLSGQENRAYTLLASSNLQYWLAYTNILGPTNKHLFEVEASRNQRFFRGLAH